MYQKQISELNAEHIKQRQEWDNIRLAMEQRHTEELIARDQLLAKREMEHKTLLAHLVEAHNKLTEENRIRHEKELADRLAENHANLQKWDADRQALRDEISANEQRHLATVD